MFARRLALGLAFAGSSLLSLPAAGQSPPYGTITPGSETYDVGTQLQVHVEMCSVSGFFDAWGTVWLNGSTIGSTQPGWNPSCSDFQSGDFTITIASGANTVSAQSSDNYGAAYVEVTYTGGQQPPPPPPPVVAPVVSPHGEKRLIAPVVGAKLPFTITNPDTLARSYTLALSCSGTVTGCSGPTQVSLNPGQVTDVWATFSVTGAEFGAGTLMLNAAAQDPPSPADTGSYAVTLAPAGPIVERDLCLTIAAGPGAAFECGDLRLIHTLPGIRTLNKARVPTLLYNSQHAHPYPLLTADVTLPAPDPLPTTVRTILRVAGAQVAQRDMAGSAWGSPGQSRRVAVGFDAQAYATGLYAFEMEIQRVTGQSITTLQLLTGTLPIVNRGGSPFGPGWWLAGLERLYFSLPSSAMWVGGDASVRRYARLNDTTYIAAPVDHPDTLLKKGSEWVRPLPGGGQVVFNSAGIHVRTTNRLGYSTTFVDSVGAQGVLTRIDVPPTGSGLSYTFTYTGTPARLSGVSAPDSAVGTSRITVLTWAGDSVRVTDPGASAPVVFRYQAGGTNRIVARKDRRGAVTSFAYDAAFRLASSSHTLDGAESADLTFCAAEVHGLAACSPTLVAPESAYAIIDGPRTDSVDVMHFWVDALGSPWKIRDPYGFITVLARSDPSWPALVTRIAYPNGRVTGAQYDARGNLRTSTDSSLYVSGQHATTRYQWDQRWDAVTEVVIPTGQVSRFGYDASNGNRLWQEDGLGAMSRVTFAYYPSGTSAALLKTVTVPGGARDSIVYDARGNVAKTVSPVGDTTFFVADRIGRQRVVRTRIGQGLYRSDTTFYDQASRPIRTVSYGPAMNGAAAGQVNVQSFYNAEGALDSLKRWSTPDPANVGTITTRWTYDLGGRRVTETAPDLALESTQYDRAGNATTVVTRRGHALQMSYDRLNRVRRRVVPGVVYPKRDSVGIAPYILGGFSARPYPYFPSDSAADPMNGGTGVWDLQIAGQTTVFAYDAMGNLVLADNDDAKVRRTYYKDGRVQTDTTKIRNWLDQDTTKHVYGITYQYDLSGRLLSLQHPLQLAPSATANTARDEYDPVTGLLAAVIDPLGNRFEYTYNARNEVIRLKAPAAGITDTLAYDLAGRLILEKLRNQSASTYKYTDSVLRRFTLTYVDPERVGTAANAFGWKDTSVSQYSGLGHLVSFKYWAPGMAGGVPGTILNQNWTWLDPLGNGYHSKDSGNVVLGNFGQAQTSTSQYPRRYGPLAGGQPTGRLRAFEAWVPGTYNDRVDTVLYDPAGNTIFTYQRGPDTYTLLQDRANWYAADGQLRVAEVRTFQRGATCCELNSWAMTFEEYRYDALGRRVVVRARRVSDAARAAGYAWPSTLGTVRRTVWAGDHELYEIQMYGGVDWQGDNGTRMENDTAFQYIGVTPANGYMPYYYDPNPRFGRVAYTYGPGLDNPLSAIRIKYVDDPYNKPPINWAPFTVVPWWNWRGRADRGTMSDGGGAVCQPGDNTRCIIPAWLLQPFQLAQQPADSQSAWFGTLLRDKEDGTGTLFRRNRYVDPATGRFTQEDPIGLAGGLNLYGFANGDPVNFSDPFGLCPQNLSALKAFLCNLIEATGTGAGFLTGFVTGGGAGAFETVASGGALAPLAVAQTAALSTAGAAAGLAAAQLLTNALYSDEGSGGGGGASKTKRPSVNQMDQEVRRGQAPRGVDAVNRGKVPGEQDHVHFRDGSALNRDGTWKHGGTTLTNAQQEWLLRGGWSLPR